MQTLIYILHYLSTHILASVIISLLVFLFMYLYKRKKKRVYLFFAIVFMLTPVFFPIFGLTLVKPLIYKYGENGTGIAVSIENTNSTHNKQRILKYNVLLKKSDGKVIETIFYSSNNLLYPNGNNFPSVEQEFTVKSLPNYPEVFIILTNDKSKFAVQQSCTELGKVLNETRVKYEFDTLYVANKKKYADAIETYFLNNNCFSDTVLNKHYKEQIKKLRGK